MHCKLIPGTNHVRVFHHQKELFGNSHVCRYNGAEQKCECVCGNNLKPADVDWNARHAAELEKQTQGWHLPLWHDAEKQMSQAMESWKHAIYQDPATQPVSHQQNELTLLEQEHIENHPNVVGTQVKVSVHQG